MAGRKQGSKNLQRKGETIVNQFGVEFTDEEKKALTSMVNSAMRKRRKMLEFEAQLPRVIAGEYQGSTLGEAFPGKMGKYGYDRSSKMGRESDFILAPKSKSLNQFKRHEDYEHYMNNLKRISARDYVQSRVAQYKENYITAIDRELLTDSNELRIMQLKHQIRSMTTKQYMQIVQADETLEIWYVYKPQDAEAKLEQIETAISAGVERLSSEGLKHGNSGRRVKGMHKPKSQHSKRQKR